MGQLKAGSSGPGFFTIRTRRDKLIGLLRIDGTKLGRGQKGATFLPLRLFWMPSSLFVVLFNKVFRKLPKA